MEDLVRRLEVLVLTNCRLTHPQLKNMLTVIGKDNTCRIQKLYLGSNDLHQLPPNVLASSVTKLCTLHCDNTYLMDNQVDALFLAMNQEISKLKELSILSVDLSSLSPSLLSSSLSYLVSANLWGTMLTLEQVEAIFNMLAVIPPPIFSKSIS